MLTMWVNNYDQFLIIRASLKDNWPSRIMVGKLFSTKGQRVTILGIVCYTVSVATTQLCCSMVKAAIKKNAKCLYGCVTVKLHLPKQVESLFAY